MIRCIKITLITVLFAFVWAPAQASTLDIVYSANTYGVFSPCPS